MLSTVNECSSLFIEILKEAPSKEVEIYEPFQALTLDVISRCALALQLDCQRNSDVSSCNVQIKSLSLFLVLCLQV